MLKISTYNLLTTPQGQIRYIERDGRLHFVRRDLQTLLGISNASMVSSKVELKSHSEAILSDAKGTPQVYSMVDSIGAMGMLFSSRSDTAIQLRRTLLEVLIMEGAQDERGLPEGVSLRISDNASDPQLNIIQWATAGDRVDLKLDELKSGPPGNAIMVTFTSGYSLATERTKAYRMGLKTRKANAGMLIFKECK